MSKEAPHVWIHVHLNNECFWAERDSVYKSVILLHGDILYAQAFERDSKALIDTLADIYTANAFARCILLNCDNLHLTPAMKSTLRIKD